MSLYIGLIKVHITLPIKVHRLARATLHWFIEDLLHISEQSHNHIISLHLDPTEVGVTVEAAVPIIEYLPSARDILFY